MEKKSLVTFHRTISIGFVVFFISSVPPLLNTTVEGAEPMIAPSGVVEDVETPTVEKKGGVVKPNPPKMAKRHILIELDPGTDEAQFQKNAKGRGLLGKGRVYGSSWLIMSIPDGLQPRQAAASARTLPGVRRATPDFIVQINDQIPPRDPIYIYDDDPTTKPCDPLIEDCDPWDMVDQWGLFKVEAENGSGWEIQRGSPEVVIAILDSGMDLDHDDLWNNIWVNPGETLDGVDEDRNGFVDDMYGYDFVGDNPGSPNDDPTAEDGNPDIPEGGTWVYDETPYPYGWGVRFEGDPAVGDALDNNMDLISDMGVFHGTFVAGVAGAMTDNNIVGSTTEFEGMAGVCWHCKLMSLRVINAEGWAYGSDAAAAVNYAADNGADVINISWGIKLDTSDPQMMEEVQILVQAIDYAVSKGVIVVAAAGNSGTADLHFPASMKNTIAVGSSNWLDRRSDFSSFARPGEIPDNNIDDDGNGWVDDVLDVVAPGELIWSTTVLSAYDALVYDLLGMVGWDPGVNMYSLADGTSFSTPLVSGYVGLILSQNPSATLDQVRDVIRSNAVDILDPNGTGSYHAGYDAYTGFGRVRIVVPELASPTNTAPVADAGLDQTVQDRGKPGTENVTLDGFGSYDDDGQIVSYQWLEGNTGIATGVRVTLNLSVGTHYITLRVTDDQNESSEDQVVITIIAKKGDQSGDPTGNDPPTGPGNGKGKKPKKK